MILDVLNSISATSSTNEKLAILKSNTNNELLKRVYRLTYHPQIQYGIKKIPFFDRSRSKPEYELEHALNCLENVIATRKVTGNAAIELLADYLCGLPSNDAEVITRIIKRDLECGASATMANKVWKDIIPKQPQMLATSMSEKALSFIKYPAYAQLKADGARCFAEIRGFERDDVKLLSRAGNEYLKLDALKDELIELYKKVAKCYPEGIMIDGEIVYAKSLNEGTQTESVESRSFSNGLANKSLKNTISDEEANQMSFQVWDFVPLNVVYGNLKGAVYSLRFLDLKNLTQNSKRLILIENTLVLDLKQAKEIYKKYVLMGLEGIILKNRESVWENKRSKNLVKFKEEITLDLRIVGFNVHSKDENKLGSIIVESEDGKIKVKCGSGFTDTNEVKNDDDVWIQLPYDELHELNRTKLWTERDSLIGKIVEMKCNGFITSEDRKDSVSLFLPIMLRFRDDKSTANTFEEAFPDSVYPLGI